MTTLGIIGAGNIGSQLARVAITLGYDVVIANSRGPETLGDLIADLGPHATAGTVEEAARAGDVVVVSVPMGAIADIPVEPLAGKIVIDTNNYYFERDGHIESLDKGETTTAGILQAHLPSSRVVKAFNHIPAPDIAIYHAPAGVTNRRALATAGDDAEAVAFVADFYDKLGLDAVNIGPLSESWRVERDRPAYVSRQNADELKANLAIANRLP